MYIIVVVTIGHVTHTYMQPGSGYWSNFFVLTNRGNLVPTRNQILIDAHFELPRGIIKLIASQLGINYLFCLASRFAP